MQAATPASVFEKARDTLSVRVSADRRARDYLFTTSRSFKYDDPILFKHLNVVNAIVYADSLKRFVALLEQVYIRCLRHRVLLEKLSSLAEKRLRLV